MIKQGWSRKEKISVRDLVPKGTLKPHVESMVIRIRIVRSYSFWTVDVDKTEPTED